MKAERDAPANWGKGGSVDRINKGSPDDDEPDPVVDAIVNDAIARMETEQPRGPDGRFGAKAAKPDEPANTQTPPLNVGTIYEMPTGERVTPTCLWYLGCMDNEKCDGCGRHHPDYIVHPTGDIYHVGENIYEPGEPTALTLDDLQPVALLESPDDDPDDEFFGKDFLPPHQPSEQPDADDPEGPPT